MAIYLTLALIVIGFVFRLFDLPGGSLFLALGFIGIAISYIVKLIRSISDRQSSNTKLSFLALSVLMAVALYSKYLFWDFGDYPSLLIIPVYILGAIYFLIKKKSSDIKLIATSVLFLMLTIPLFGLKSNIGPRQYIPEEWYTNKYDDVKVDHSIRVDYSFESNEAKELCEKGKQLRISKNYHQSIKAYREALKVEGNNPKIYFELSNTYTYIDQLDNAIATLDTAIILNSNEPAYYNNRGLIYYKLSKNSLAIKDYKKAITLDPDQPIYHANLAFVYYYINDLDKACHEIRMAESQKYSMQDRLYNRIKEHCK